DLAQLAQGLSTLKDMSLTINSSLASQNEIIDSLDAASDAANERMRRVVRRAGRLNGRAGWKDAAVWSAWVTVKAVVAGRPFLLGVRGERFLLVEEARARFSGRLRDCVVWGHHKRPAYNAAGLRSAATGCYLGVNTW
ncbi:hypothetical protein TeGR_g3919, partial [Tetraparma gracilis]